MLYGPHAARPAARPPYTDVRRYPSQGQALANPAALTNAVGAARRAAAARPPYTDVRRYPSQGQALANPAVLTNAVGAARRAARPSSSSPRGLEPFGYAR